MKKYYAERKGLIQNKYTDITLSKLLIFFGQTFRYFKRQKYFDCAENGVWEYKDSFEVQIHAPLFAPSPEIFFINHFQKTNIWPIWEHYDNYTEEDLFTVIEILYDNIAEAVYDDYNKLELKREEPKKEFAEHINNILKMYCTGYYLEPQNGFIMKLPNEALKQQLSYNGDEIEDQVYDQLSTATEMYYRFNSNMEMKKKAVNILADILENRREDVKNLLNSEYKINKNNHDKLIFEIVNKFNIRHNRDGQKTNYSKEIWYDWMMQYYTSVIIAFYRLETNYRAENFLNSLFSEDK